MRKVAIVIAVIMGGAISTLAQSCLPDGITFTTQSQIDSFQIIYPNCIEIEGDVLISGDNITNLNGLIGLDTIGGSLTIKCYQDSLTTLTGLDSLKFIGESLFIDSNYYLVNLKGLHRLSYIGDDLHIKRNYYNLNSIEGLENITSVKGNLIIAYNQYLESLKGLDNLKSIDEGYLLIQLNNSLVNLQGLNSLSFVKHQIEISGNHDLENLTGLENITTTEGSLIIINCTGLETLTGLENLTTIGETLHIRTVSITSGLVGLNNLQSIGRHLVISNAYSFSNLQGLSSLESVGGELKIENTSLQNLRGLEELTSVGGNISIGWNDNLKSLKGIENVDTASIMGLWIFYNPQLSLCEVKSVCDYISIDSANVSIHDNETDCNSKEEVKDACESINIYEYVTNQRLSTYPNPFTTSITIEYELTEPSLVQLSIYNAIGETIYVTKEGIKQQGMHTFTWSPERLPEGLYYGVLRSEEGVSVVKMVKQ